MTVAVDLFRVLAACTSTLMLLSPIPMIVKVWKTKTTGVASIVPLATMFANSHNNALYGYLSEHYFPIFSTFVLGDLLCVVYITIFYSYSHEKRKAHLVFLGFGSVLALLTIYAFLGGYGVVQTRHQVANVSAYVAVLTNLLLYSSPFEKVAKVLKHRSAVFINIHMVCAGTFNNAVWIAYTALTRQWILFVPMVVCCSMGCIQIVLFGLFHPSTHPYTGPIPGLLPLTTAEETDDRSHGALDADPCSSRTRTKTVRVVYPESPVFVALESLQPQAPKETRQ